MTSTQITQYHRDWQQKLAAVAIAHAGMTQEPDEKALLSVVAALNAQPDVKVSQPDAKVSQPDAKLSQTAWAVAQALGISRRRRLIWLSSGREHTHWVAAEQMPGAPAGDLIPVTAYAQRRPEGWEVVFAVDGFGVPKLTVKQHPDRGSAIEHFERLYAYMLGE